MAWVNKLSIRYVIQSLVIIVVVSAAVIGFICVTELDNMFLPVTVSIVFSVVIECSDAAIWRLVARNSPDSLPSFYMGVSGFRMLLSLLTMFIYWFAEGKDAMLPFFLVFIVYYVSLLIHHSVFFSRVSNTCDKLKNVK